MIVTPLIFQSQGLVFSNRERQIVSLASGHDFEPFFLTWRASCRDQSPTHWWLVGEGEIRILSRRVSSFDVKYSDAETHLFWCWYFPARRSNASFNPSFLVCLPVEVCASYFGLLAGALNFNALLSPTTHTQTEWVPFFNMSNMNNKFNLVVTGQTPTQLIDPCQITKSNASSL